MKGASRCLAALLCASTSSNGVASPTPSEQPERHSTWSNSTALTPATGRVELGVFSESSWALTPRIELRLHPIAFLVFPHVETKLRWVDAGQWQLSSLHRLSYPTPFVMTISREGSGGLLPLNTDPPQALLISNHFLGSLEWRPHQWATVQAGASVSTATMGSVPVVDFPFLYPRLAALHAPLVPTLAANFTGEFATQLGYELELLHTWLWVDSAPLRHSTEIYGALHWRPNADHQMSVGGRFSRAEFPIGWRSYFLPHIDYRISL